MKYENLDVLHLERYVSKGLSGASDCGGGRKARGKKDAVDKAVDPAAAEHDRPASPVSDFGEEQDGQ